LIKLSQVKNFDEWLLQYNATQQNFQLAQIAFLTENREGMSINTTLGYFTRHTTHEAGCH